MKVLQQCENRYCGCGYQLYYHRQCYFENENRTLNLLMKRTPKWSDPR